MTGTICTAGSLSCLNADGSGWLRVANSAVQDGDADHCFIVNSTDGAWCHGLDAAHPLDVGWLPPARETWSLATNLDWLAAFAGPWPRAALCAAASACRGGNMTTMGFGGRTIAGAGLLLWLVGCGGGNPGGAGGAAGWGTGGACATADRLCPARYVAMGAAVPCTPESGSPCWDDEPCGAGRRVSGRPNFENTLTCIYDRQGAIVSATSCGYDAHYTHCVPGCSPVGGPYCAGSFGCYHAGTEVSCPADGGSD